MAIPVEEQTWKYSPVPSDALRLFRMCWQLENWLRLIVYVELRAHQVDWETPIKAKVRDWPPNSLERDKRLHHMATPHQAGLSYLTFGELWTVVSSPDCWDIFASYFPPKDNTDARIAEVKAIRNRIAHFREPHPQDAARLELFMRDMEQGIRRFCNRYTVPVRPRDPAADPVSAILERDWDHVGYGVELLHPHGWLYAPGPHRMHPLMNGRLEMLIHPDSKTGKLEGIIYRVTVMSGVGNRAACDTVDILNTTRSIHGDIIHLIVSHPYHEVSMTIPAVHGAEKTAEFVGEFLRAGLEAMQGSVPTPSNRHHLDWPEYVLWPDHMLAIYADECQEPILAIE